MTDWAEGEWDCCCRQWRAFQWTVAILYSRWTLGGPVRYPNSLYRHPLLDGASVSGKTRWRKIIVDRYHPVLGGSSDLEHDDDACQNWAVPVSLECLCTFFCSRWFCAPGLQCDLVTQSAVGWHDSAPRSKACRKHNILPKQMLVQHKHRKDILLHNVIVWVDGTQPYKGRVYKRREGMQLTICVTQRSNFTSQDGILHFRIRSKWAVTSVLLPGLAVILYECWCWANCFFYTPLVILKSVLIGNTQSLPWLDNVAPESLLCKSVVLHHFPHFLKHGSMF